MKKFICKIIIFILGFLGLSTPLFAPQYGVPSVNCKLDGEVISKKNKKPIKNIEIELKKYNVVYTDENGEWIFDGKLEESYTAEKVKIVVRDIDGKENGGYFDEKEIQLTLDQTDVDLFEGHNIIIELEEKE